jgi:hypothetical protein
MIIKQIKGVYMVSKRNFITRSVAIVFAVFIAFQIQGCNTNNINNPSSTSLSLSFATNQGLNKSNLVAIELDTIKILIRDIKLENESDSSDYESHWGMHSDTSFNYRSEDIKVGPFVVYLNLNGITTDFAVNNIPAGSYNEIKFKIHQIQASEVPPDPEFKEGNDNSLRYSVIVKGKYNSIPFVYKSRKSASQKIMLDTLLVVQENSITNLTISVDPTIWFMDGQTELDPTDSTNAYLIDKNISRSFRSAFEDDDHDGQCDKHHDGYHHN